MIKLISLRILRWKLKNTLPKISNKVYKKLFSLTYKFFYILKPSQIWVIVLALLNKTEFKKLLGIPTIFILFSSVFTDNDSIDSKVDSKTLNTKITANKFDEPENNWENFFWVLIIIAIIKRFLNTLFKFLWIPFKVALIYYILKYFGFDFSILNKIFNILNNISLGIVDWFYDKITNFLNFFNNRND